MPASYPDHFKSSNRRDKMRIRNYFLLQAQPFRAGNGLLRYTSALRYRRRGAWPGRLDAARRVTGPDLRKGSMDHVASPERDRFVRVVADYSQTSCPSSIVGRCRFCYSIVRLIDYEVKPNLVTCLTLRRSRDSNSCALFVRYQAVPRCRFDHTHSRQPRLKRVEERHYRYSVCDSFLPPAMRR